MRHANSIIILFLFSMPWTASAQLPLRLGMEFQVNIYTTGIQALPALAEGADGSAIITWHSIDQDRDGIGVYARRFDSSGTSQSGEFQVSSYTTGDQSSPLIASSPSGNFVIVWNSVGYFSGQDGDSWGVFGQRYSKEGIPEGTEFQVNTSTIGGQALSAIARRGRGNFVVTWFSQTTFGPASANLQRFSYQGFRAGQETEFSDFYPFSIQHNGQDGFYVVSIRGSSPIPSSNDIVVQPLSSHGDALGNEFQISDEQGTIHDTAQVVCNSGGSCLVVWNSTPNGSSGQGNGRDGSGSGVFARRIGSAGTVLGAQFQVNIHTIGDQSSPAVSMNEMGDFVIVWTDRGLPICDRICISGPSQDGSGMGIFGRTFNSVGQATSGEFQVNTYTTGDQDGPVVLTLDSSFIVVWHGVGQDGTPYSVYGQRFSLSPDPDASPLSVQMSRLGQWLYFLLVVLALLGKKAMHSKGAQFQ